VHLRNLMPVIERIKLAIYSFIFKHGSRGKGQRALSHIKYILRSPPYSYNAEQLKYHESGNLPEWAKDEMSFWKMVDKYEKPVNARLYSEFEVALPRELKIEQQVVLLKQFIQEEIKSKHPYTFALHHSSSMDGKGHPHAHIMFSTRTNDTIKRCEISYFKMAKNSQPERGGAIKDRSWMKPSRLHELRISWEHHANVALEHAGFTARIDHRSLKARGIDRMPEPRLTPLETMLWKQGIATEKVQLIKALREARVLEAKLDQSNRLLKKLLDYQVKTLQDEHKNTYIKYKASVQKLLKSVEISERLKNDVEQYRDKLNFNKNSDGVIALSLQIESAVKQAKIVDLDIATYFTEAQNWQRQYIELQTKLQARGAVFVAEEKRFKAHPALRSHRTAERVAVRGQKQVQQFQMKRSRSRKPDSQTQLE
jgi:MobA/MobL family